MAKRGCLKSHLGGLSLFCEEISGFSLEDEVVFQGGGLGMDLSSWDDSWEPEMDAAKARLGHECEKGIDRH